MVDLKTDWGTCAEAIFEPRQVSLLILTVLARLSVPLCWNLESLPGNLAQLFCLRKSERLRMRRNAFPETCLCRSLNSGPSSSGIRYDALKSCKKRTEGTQAPKSNLHFYQTRSLFCILFYPDNFANDGHKCLFSSFRSLPPPLPPSPCWQTSLWSTSAGLLPPYQTHQVLPSRSPSPSPSLCRWSFPWGCK